MALKRARLFWIAAGALSLLVILGGIAAGPIMSRVEQPDFKVISSEGSIELRQYGPMIAAEVEVQGERKAAIQEGFRLIAAYIFGANSPNAKIAMTAPVQQQNAQNIAMTAPVTQQTDGNKWMVRFIMPSSWSLDTLPTPNDERVTLKPIPPKRMAVIRFSGTANDNLIRSKTDELRKYTSDQKLATVGEPTLAFYNPPWTLPFLRRNEVMLELAERQGT
jgi:hypothetical protein